MNRCCGSALKGVSGLDVQHPEHAGGKIEQVDELRVAGNRPVRIRSNRAGAHILVSTADNNGGRACYGERRDIRWGRLDRERCHVNFQAERGAGSRNPAGGSRDVVLAGGVDRARHTGDDHVEIDILAGAMIQQGDRLGIRCGVFKVDIGDCVIPHKLNGYRRGSHVACIAHVRTHQVSVRSIGDSCVQADHIPGERGDGQSGRGPGLSSEE